MRSMFTTTQGGAEKPARSKVLWWAFRNTFHGSGNALSANSISLASVVYGANLLQRLTCDIHSTKLLAVARNSSVLYIFAAMSLNYRGILVPFGSATSTALIASSGALRQLPSNGSLFSADVASDSTPREPTAVDCASLRPVTTPLSKVHAGDPV